MITAEKEKVAVIGAGIIGTMSAWQLAKRGFEVEVFEQWNTPNDRGASAGESRIFRTIYKEGSEYVPILRKSKIMWDELQQKQATNFLDMCGGLTIGHPDQEDVAAVIACARAEGLEHSIFDAREMNEKYPQFGLESDEVGVYDPAAGVFRPELAVLAARDESRALGVAYHPYMKALQVRPLVDGVMVDTHEGAKKFDKVVLASGPWANELTGFGPDIIGPKRLVALWFPAKDVPLHEPANMPISIRRNAYGGFSCFPLLDGVSVKILPHHLAWTDLDHVEDLPRFIEPEFVRSTEQAVSQLMPGLEPTSIRVSTWTEGFTKDGAPLVGLSPADDRIVLAIGMSGQGFKFSPMIGSIVTDFVESGKSNESVSFMDTKRFAGSMK